MQENIKELRAEISACKRTEETLARLNRHLQTLYECNRALIHATNESELLQSICEILVKIGGLRMVWVGYREFDEQKTIRPIAQAGHDEGYVASVKVTWADTERGRGPAGVAIRTGKVCSIQDVQTDMGFAPWRTEALSRGYLSCVALPLLSDGEPFGALGLYASEPGAFNEQALEQFTELANNLAFGAMALRTRRERNCAEEKLRRSEAYLAEGQRLSHTGSWAWVIATGEIFWSQEMYRIFGLDPATAKLNINSIVQYRHPEDRDFVQRTFDVAIRERKDFEIESRIICPDGAIKQLHTVGHPFFDETGSLTEFIGVVMDVSEQRRTEGALREAQSELARVARATMMGELTTSIAHEVNQPLAAVVTNANACFRWLAAEPPNFDEARAAVQRIVRDGNRASEVITHIRSLLKKGRSLKTRLNVNDVIHEVVALARSEVRQRGATLQTDLAADLPLVFADRVQLQQLLMNLVMNALDAMNTETCRSRLLRLHTRAHESNAILVAVQDSGIGLEAKQMERLFEAFYTTKPEGLGLGLSISRSIVEAHGGRLWAVLNDGPGATFQFTLPIEHEET